MHIRIELSLQKPKEILNNIKETISNKIIRFKQKIKLKLLMIWQNTVIERTGVADISPILLSVEFKRIFFFIFKVYKHNKEIGIVNLLTKKGTIKSELSIVNLLLSTRALSIDEGRLVIYSANSVRYLTVVEVYASNLDSTITIKTPFAETNISFKHLQDYIPYLAEKIAKYCK